MKNLKSTPIDSKVVILLKDVRAWAEKRSDISAVALVGSHAHGRARPDSDIDIVILSDNPDPLRSPDWLSAFGAVSHVDTENWGVLTSHRTHYVRDGEVEVGVASTSWANIPIDPGTFRVGSDGLVSVYDPRGILDRLVMEVRRSRTE
jgi:hypothetical protein